MPKMQGFSIRNRIELFGHVEGFFIEAIALGFQYPQPDRIVWVQAARPAAQCDWFQYPQPDRIVWAISITKTVCIWHQSFSIRNRIELFGPFTTHLIASNLEVSVSATGSNCLGCIYDRANNTNHTFQYPQPDRIVWAASELVSPRP